MWVHFQMYKLSHPEGKLKHFRADREPAVKRSVYKHIHSHKHFSTGCCPQSGMCILWEALKEGELK